MQRRGFLRKLSGALASVAGGQAPLGAAPAFLEAAALMREAASPTILVSSVACARQQARHSQPMVVCCPPRWHWLPGTCVLHSPLSTLRSPEDLAVSQQQSSAAPASHDGEGKDFLLVSSLASAPPVFFPSACAQRRAVGSRSVVKLESGRS